LVVAAAAAAAGLAVCWQTRMFSVYSVTLNS
jgi:hypothetical protein